MGVWSQRPKDIQNPRDYKAERGGWEETIRFCQDPSFRFQGDFFQGELSGFVGDRVCSGEEVTKVVRNRQAFTGLRKGRLA